MCHCRFYREIIEFDMDNGVGTTVRKCLVGGDPYNQSEKCKLASKAIEEEIFPNAGKKHRRKHHFKG